MPRVLIFRSSGDCRYMGRLHRGPRQTGGQRQRSTRDGSSAIGGARRWISSRGGLGWRGGVEKQQWLQGMEDVRTAGQDEAGREDEADKELQRSG